MRCSRSPTNSELPKPTTLWSFSQQSRSELPRLLSLNQRKPKKTALFASFRISAWRLTNIFPTAYSPQSGDARSHFGVPSLADVASNIMKIGEREGVKQEAEKASAEIIAALETENLEEAEAELNCADRDALAEEAQRLTGLRDHQNNLCEESSTRYRLAEGKVEAVGGDDAVARIEEKKRTILLDTEERAHQYLRLRIRHGSSGTSVAYIPGSAPRLDGASFERVSYNQPGCVCKAGNPGGERRGGSRRSRCGRQLESSLPIIQRNTLPAVLGASSGRLPRVPR